MTFLWLNCVRVVCDRIKLSDNYNWKLVHIVLKRGYAGMYISFFVWHGVSKTYLMQRSCTRLLIVIIVNLTGWNHARTDQIHGGYLWPENMIELSGIPVASWLWHSLEIYDTDTEAETWTFILADYRFYMRFVCLYLSNYISNIFFSLVGLLE